MFAYLFAIFWTMCAVIGMEIAKSRGVKLGFWWNMTLVFFGPLAIPFVFLIKPRGVLVVLEKS